MSKTPSSRRNLVRFSEDRLQAVSSRNMYSLHGFDARIGAVFGQVCQVLMVVSYCTPGSAQPHALSASLRQRSFAGYCGPASPVVRKRVVQVPPASTAFMKSSV